MDIYLAALVNSILSNLTVIKIIFFILSILTVTNAVVIVLVVPILSLLFVISVEFKGVHHLNHVFPKTGLTFIRILISACIGWEKKVLDWAHSLDLAPILAISWGGTTRIEV